MSCRSACFKRQIFVCQVVCFFVLSMCFRPLLLTCQTVEGRHTVSHLLYWWCFWALGGGFLQWTRLPDLPSEWFALWRAWQWDNWRVTDYNERLTTPLLRLFLSPECCILVRFCVNQMSVWAKIQIPVFSLSLGPYRPTSTSQLRHPSSQPLRVDVAVLTTSSKGQDPTFSSVCLTSHMRCTYRPSHHHPKMSLNEGKVAETLVIM